MAFGKKHTDDQADDEYFVVPLIPVDYTVHTPDNPFCDDPTCPCHEDPDNIEMVHQAYEDGIVTANDATDIVKGVKSW